MDVPNDLFCSLDMLAEVASMTLRNEQSITSMPLQPSKSNDHTLISNMPLQRSKSNIKVSSSLARKSVNSSDKLTLDQIKCLSEKNLIEMFSENICDEMKRNYSFQCYLIPDKCSQVYNSFGSEMKARCKMKIHLLNHVKELVAAAEASINSEIFMAEPLHIRKKRLKEVTRKNTRKKKQTKPLSNKYRKDNTFDYDADDVRLFKTEGQSVSKAVKQGSLNSAVKTDFSSWSTAYKKCFSENNHDYVDVAGDFKYLPYCSDNTEYTHDDQLILTGQSYKRQRSNTEADSKKKVSSAFELSDYEGWKSQLNCDAQSESEISLAIIHDHTYSLVLGKAFDSPPSSSGESSKSSYKMYRDPLEPKKVFHECLQRESPLIIPTLPFPHVYVPVLPHIARIQEIGYNFKTSGKCKNHDFSEGLCYPCYIMPKPVNSLPKNECLRNSLNFIPFYPAIDKIHPSDAIMIDAIYGYASSNADNDIKIPGSFFFFDLFKHEWS